MLQIFMSVKEIVPPSTHPNKVAFTPFGSNPRVMPNSWAGGVSVALSEIIGHPFSLDSERGLL